MNTRRFRSRAIVLTATMLAVSPMLATQAHAQFGITRNRHAAHQHLLEPGVAHRLVHPRLARADQLSLLGGE